MITVSFKDEAEIDGITVGPVVITDIDLYNADPVVVANTERRANGATVVGVPYGYVPQGETHLGWKTLPEALRIAADHGVELARW